MAEVTTPSHFQRALFANADSRSANHSLLPYTVWTSRIMYSAQALAFPLAFWFKPACLFFALVWLTYRAYQVLNKPLEELAALLGFDIPFTPIIDLAGVKADGAVIHWSLPEKQKHRNTLKYEIHINGNVVDTVSLQESAVSITGLQPGSFYVVRVALVNSLEFSSKSSPIRFRTKQANSGDFYGNAGEGQEPDMDGVHEILPQVKPYRGLKDFTPASPDTSAPMMARENSSGGLHKRSITGRRPSPVALGLETRHEASFEASESHEGLDTIQELTQKLDAIRYDTEEAERLAKEDEEEELRQKEELIMERDQLRAESGEKDKANRDLKRQINLLERQNTAAQNERSKHERILQQKKQEREKLKEDTIRWEQEAVKFKEEIEKIKQQKVEFLEEAAREKETLRQQQLQEAAEVRSLDEEIRLKVVEMKKLDRVAKNGSPNGAEPENNLVQQYQQDAEDERAFQMRRYELQHQYAAAVQNLERAKALHATNVRFLDNVRADRRRTEEAAAAASAAREFPSPPPASDRGIRRGDSQRSRNTTNDSPRMTTFPAVTSSPFGNGLTSTSFSTAPFLNIHNGMTISRPSEAMDITEDEKDRLTGGAPMSPGAGAEFLPADLFSNDDNRSAAEDVRPLAGLGALPGLGAISLPGLGAQPGQQENQAYGPNGPTSPTSPPSRAGSLFASPRASQNNLPTSPDNHMDSDRRSVHSTRSSRAQSSANTGSRFSSMFGMKSRLKNSSMDESIAGPALGKVQSQSMPRQDQGIPGLDSASRRRNSSISGPMFGDMLGKDGAADAEGGAENNFYEPTSQPRRRAFNLNPFSKDKGPDGWPANFIGGGRRPASPRPGSTHSSEFPRPSLDSGRWGADAWPSNDAMSGARGSPLSYGGWNTPGQSRIFGSRHPSRRPSVQHGASGPPEDILEDEDSDALDAERKPHLAPIGTKPPPGSKQPEKKTEEPAADTKSSANTKDIKNFFSSIKLSSKDKEKLREAREAEASSSQTPNSSTHGLGVDDESPPASRKSRDARSTTTVESSVAESLRNSMDLTRTPSYSNASETTSNASPMLGSGSFGKESFIAKLQRKHSSGMAFLPTFKRDKSRLDPTAAAANGEDVDDETAALSGSTGSLGRESREANRGSRSWSNALKIGKKKGGETPSVSGLSITSGADEEEGKER